MELLNHSAAHSVQYEFWGTKLLSCGHEHLDLPLFVLLSLFFETSLSRQPQAHNLDKIPANWSELFLWAVIDLLWY
jgi:hypothetical protein